MYTEEEYFTQHNYLNKHTWMKLIVQNSCMIGCVQKDIVQRNSKKGVRKQRKARKFQRKASCSSYHHTWMKKVLLYLVGA